MKDPNNPCLFCNIKESGFTHQNTLAYASYDSYPVTNHHCLIIPKRHVSNYFTLTLVNAATSTAKGGGAFVFGGPPNQTNQYPR